MPKRRLIVNADDFGQSKGINKGIIRAHEKGIVTSTSLMVRYPAAVEAAEYARGNTTLGVGLHLDLGEWVYKDDNWTMSYRVVDLDDKNAIKNEIRNQVDMFFEVIGRKPTHIDSHQHAHLSASILPLVEDVASELDVTLRGRSNRVHYCGNFYGQSDDGQPHHEIISLAGLYRILSELPDLPTIELGCHPALSNDLETMYKEERALEVETLCSSGLKEDIVARGFELCTFEGLCY